MPFRVFSLRQMGEVEDAVLRGLVVLAIVPALSDLDGCDDDCMNGINNGYHTGYSNGLIDAVAFCSLRQMGEVEDAVCGAGGACDSHGAVRPVGVNPRHILRQRPARGGSVVHPRQQPRIAQRLSRPHHGVHGRYRGA